MMPPQPVPPALQDQPPRPRPALGQRRWSRVALATALALGVAATAAWMLRPAPVTVELAPVREGPLQVWIEEEARSRVRDRHGIHAPVSGQLLRLRVTEGDPIRQGEVIARIAPAQPQALDPRSLRSQQATVAAAQAMLEAAQAREARAQSMLAQSEIDLARIESLAARGFIASSRLESERLALASARREWEALQASRDAAQQELIRARAGLIEPSPALQPPPGRVVEIRAPVDGVVLKRTMPDPTPVQAGALLLDLGDISAIEVITDLLTTQAVHVRAGQAVELYDWGGAETLHGTIGRVEPGAFTKISALGVEEQRVRAVILLSPRRSSSAPVLGDGWRLQARILVRSLEPMVQVPAAAVFPWPGAQRPDPTQLGVFVAVNGRARLRALQGVDRNADLVAVRQGLEVGESVVLYPPSRLREGDRIRSER